MAQGVDATPRRDMTTPAPAPSDGATSEKKVVLADAQGRLEEPERDTLLRLAWLTLRGHLTDHPIQDRDLAAFNLTPRLLASRGCFITLRKGGEVRGSQGEIDASRPLYQQVIFFTRRAATRDARFLPLTDRDLAETTIEIAVIGARTVVAGPGEVLVERQGLFLEKWGRRALFLPGQAAAKGWGAERALDELCHQAKLPAGAWKTGARIEIFDTEAITGTEPPTAAPSETPAPGPSPVPEAKPSPVDATGGTASDAKRLSDGARRTAARYPI